MGGMMGGMGPGGPPGMPGQHGLMPGELMADMEGLDLGERQAGMQPASMGGVQL